MTPPSAISSRSSWWSTEGIQSPWIQPLGRAVRDEDPPRADLLPFACAAFLARSRADVLSFAIAADGAQAKLAARRRGRKRRRLLRAKRRGEWRTVAKTPSRRFIKGCSRVADW